MPPSSVLSASASPKATSSPSHSAESSLSTTPKVSSPLNPAHSPRGMPPLSLPEEDDDDDLDGYPEPPTGQTRGVAQSLPKKPLAASGSSSPSPVVRVTSSPASTTTALPGDRQEGRLASLFSPRQRSRSPSGRINDNVWRKKVNETDTPPSVPRPLDSSPASSWWGERSANAKSWEDPPKKRKNISEEETKAWNHTKERVSVAIKSVLDVTLDVAHELLSVGSDFLEFAPIPGLSPAARALLEIWDAMQSVDLNTLSCLRLTERCAETLIAVRQEVHGAGNSVAQELQGPLNKLQEAFDSVRRLLVKEAHRPFIKRYLKRDEIMRDIAQCDADIRAALDMFNLSVSIRILKQTQESERKRYADTQALMAAMLSQKQEAAPSNALMLSGITEETASPPQSPQSGASKEPAVSIEGVSQMSADQLQAAIASLQLAQNASDRAQDSENLRQLMRLALHTTRDADIMDILQIKRQDMPEAIKTLQRALERVCDRDRDVENPPSVAPAPAPTTKPPLYKRFSILKDDKARAAQKRAGTFDSTSSGSGSLGAGKGDTLDREFLESGIEALVRMSRGFETNLPSWTITKYEVDRDQKIGIGFFSDVYKGTWRNRTVAIKVLADTTPRELFKREVAIWKTLKHPNVLELFGASSTTGDPPWFFVSPYEKNGSLNEFLKRIQSQARSSGSSFGSRKSPLLHGGSLPPVPGPARTERQATFPIWQGVNSDQLGQPRGKSPARDAEYKRSRDLHRFIYEIAKGMEYLHSQNVHHGDLKAANVLVDNNLRCVISDFGQSEMKSEAFSISGATPPRRPFLLAAFSPSDLLCADGTLRWQAPELMRGTLPHLTKEMDVYSYAVLCVEVLNWGTLPWAYTDDFAVRRLVLDENERPSLPVGSRYVTPGLQDLVRVCWDKDPAKRPPFSDIVVRMKAVRRAAGDIPLDDLSSPRITELPELDDEFPHRPSPDIRPIALPSDDTPLQQAASEDATDRLPHRETSVPTTEIKFPEPYIYTPTVSRQSTVLVSPTSESSEGSRSSNEIPPTPIYNTHTSPPPESDIITQIRDERRYRMILTHDYNPSLVLPLWEPSPVDLGAVGYLAKPRGAFITLFNALHPNRSPLEAVRALPRIDGYGRVNNESQRSMKRNQLLDTIMGLLTLKKNDGTFPQPVSRRYSFPLKAGHKAAFLCAESTEYRYMISEEGQQLDSPKRWFKANVDNIMKIFGAQHQIQREELFLVVGILRASDYALFVSHNHPEGHRVGWQAHFNVFASPKNGRPWGIFTTDSVYDGAGPSGDAPDESLRQSASKVSAHNKGSWDTVLLARLRFKPDVGVMRFPISFLGLVALATLSLANPGTNFRDVIKDLNVLRETAGSLEGHAHNSDLAGMIKDKNAIIEGLDRIANDAKAAKGFTSTEASEVLDAIRPLSQEMIHLASEVIAVKDNIPSFLHGTIASDLGDIITHARAAGDALAILTLPKPDKKHEAVRIYGDIASALNGAVKVFSS
ncbi:hypothetical protein NP233_g2522 [Leucocoprinus birnbaumii]|uniref:Protein kinase domain-containing protein n=1 Tax=Leucocoprinus birnbaumii TaxID=56174 RepID=A0AAD5VY45_9AGAR|nr:hypothetical protein NP233_g2522 [Leucocoprinus birnbaumii]